MSEITRLEKERRRFVKTAYAYETRNEQVKGVPDHTPKKIKETVDRECEALKEGRDPSWWITCYIGRILDGSLP